MDKDGRIEEQGIFTAFINKFLALKVVRLLKSLFSLVEIVQEASGWPSNYTTPEQRAEYVSRYAAQGVIIDPAKVAYNPGARQTAKLLLNSLVSLFSLKRIIQSIFSGGKRVRTHGCRIRYSSRMKHTSASWQTIRISSLSTSKLQGRRVW